MNKSIELPIAQEDIYIYAQRTSALDRLEQGETEYKRIKRWGIVCSELRKLGFLAPVVTLCVVLPKVMNKELGPDATAGIEGASVWLGAGIYVAFDILKGRLQSRSRDVSSANNEIADSSYLPKPQWIEEARRAEF